jgi:UDP-galactopyranose mutase
VGSEGGSILRFDHMVVGAGFAGSVVAERLARAGRQVLLVERRNHVGGNAYDAHDEAGVLIHVYGPHIFHTNSERVVQYLGRFTRWRPYEHRVLAQVDGRLLPFPINLDTVNSLYGWNLTSAELEHYFARIAERVTVARTSEDAVVSKIGRHLYETFFVGYTRKHWGLDPKQLDASVAARVPARTDRDDRYFTDWFQSMPAEGYTVMFQRMLDHPNITVLLDTDFRDVRRRIDYDHTVFTGPIDEFFEYRFGPLPYRSLEFRRETHNQPYIQPVATINHPNDHDYTRVTEFKHLTGQIHPKTSLAFEYPRAEGEPFYPIPRPENGELYRQYRILADEMPEVDFIGRLASYRYYNMDQVVAQALTLADRLVGREKPDLRHHCNGIGHGAEEPAEAPSQV